MRGKLPASGALPVLGGRRREGDADSPDLERCLIRERGSEDGAELEFYRLELLNTF